jgi:nucleotide-binding universal stress UspA family protein
MYKRILVPVDGSATSAKGLEEAIRLAKLTGASLELVNVVDEMSLALGVEAYANAKGH